MNFCNECGRRTYRQSTTGLIEGEAPMWVIVQHAETIDACTGCAFPPNLCRCLPIDYISSPVINTSPDVQKK